MKKVMLMIFAIGILVAAYIGSAQASTISWTDWTSRMSSEEVLGNLIVGGETVNVTFSGANSFAQTNGGDDYWYPVAPYISSSVDNAPPAYDIIGLDAGGTETITFSKMVKDPVLALVSWNWNTVDFGEVPIEILSYGTGYWGYGVPELNADGTGFYGNGEVHGVIRLNGDFNTISFTHTSEYWHGLTVGVTGVTPEPASMLLFGIGGAVMALRRKFSRKA